MLLGLTFKSPEVSSESCGLYWNDWYMYFVVELEDCHDCMDLVFSRLKNDRWRKNLELFATSMCAKLNKENI